MIDRRNLVFFIGGFLAGCVSGYLIDKGRRNAAESSEAEKGKMIRRTDDVISDIYLRGMGEKELHRRRKDATNETAERRLNAPVRPSGQYERHMPQEERPVDRAELEHPTEAASAEEMEADAEWADSITRREDENRGRRPRIISADALGDLDSTWDVRTLYYYAYNDVLATEDGEIIDDIGMAVGDCLDKYRFASDSGQRNIIVQNFDFSTVYEIEKVFGEYIGL